MRHPRSLKDVDIQDLLDLEVLQTVQDTFARLAEVASVITDAEGRLLTRPINTESLENPDGCARISVGGRHLANWYVGNLPATDALEADRRDLLCASMDRVATLLSRQAMRHHQLQHALDARREAECERDRLEDHLRQAAKLEALGRLSGGVAHDFNNLLTAIQGYSELLEAEIGDRPEARDILEHLCGVTRKASDMVRGLLDFARKDQHRTEPVVVNAVVCEATKLLQPSLNGRVSVQHDLDGDEPVVMGDHGQIENAILNLCLNARDAMPAGGRIRIATRLRELAAAECRLHPNIGRPGWFVEISVQDEGIGMSSQTRERIFEPFFTTKDKGQGTGLGLAGVYSCVKAHGGGVDVASELGEGTTITLYLPLAVARCARAAVEAPVDVAIPPTPAGPRRILVVDDEEPVRLLVRKILSRAGYEVVTCQDGVEALEVWRQGPHSFDLVVLDLVMPRLGGQAALAAMLAEDGQTRVLVISGYAAGAAHGRNGLGGACGFLPKPFRPVELLAEVERILAAVPLTLAGP
jgi:signal transduction histidine kinase/ActR/RegA family two-component response regulator